MTGNTALTLIITRGTALSLIITPDTALTLTIARSTALTQTIALDTALTLIISCLFHGQCQMTVVERPAHVLSPSGASGKQVVVIIHYNITVYVYVLY